MNAKETPNPDLLTSNLYQIVPKRGAKQQGRTHPQHQLLGTGCTVLLPLWGSQWRLGQADHNTDDLDTLCEPARRIYAKKIVCACLHAYMTMYVRDRQVEEQCCNFPVMLSTLSEVLQQDMKCGY